MLNHEIGTWARGQIIIATDVPTQNQLSNMDCIVLVIQLAMTSCVPVYILGSPCERACHEMRGTRTQGFNNLITAQPDCHDTLLTHV